MSKLQLVNSEKLDRLLSAYEEDRKKSRLVENATDPTLRELTESETNLHKSNDINLRESAVIQFNKKRQKYKKEHAKSTVAGGEEQGPEGGEMAKPKSSVSESKKKITKFIKDKGLKFSTVNETDMIEDLSRMSKTRFNTTETQRTMYLRRLQVYGMPASYINNPKLKAQYIAKAEVGTSSTTPKPSRPLLQPSSSDDDEPLKTYFNSRKDRREKI